ncbi:MAG: ATP-dependent DNA ligase [Candidatus Thorarchaeota archaeon]
MRIEEITANKLKEAPDKELYSLRLRFVQLYNKNFKGNRNTKVGTLNRSDFLQKYKLLIKEMKDRNLTHAKVTDIDVEVFRKAMFGGLDVGTLGDVVIVENYLSIAGSFVKSPTEANDIDVIVRDSSSNRDEGLELKVGRLLEKETEKLPHFVYSPRGPHSSYIPLFDLVLRSKEETKRVKIREGQKVEKQGIEYFASLDNWDEALLFDNYEVVKRLAEGSVLDLGCGTGRLLKLLEQSGRKVSGVDNSDEALKFCKKKALDVIKLDLENKKLPFDDESWDNVIAVHSLEHIKNTDNTINEAVRVAKKKIVILVPLGKRQDFTHVHVFKKIDDFKKLFKGHNFSFTYLEDTNSAIAELNKEKLKKAALTPMGSFDPPKPTMSGLTEAFSVEEIWNWAKDRELVAEPKLNGIRVVICKQGDRIKILTENRKDRSKSFPQIIEQLKKIKDDFILDGSMGIERGGKPLPRIKLMTLMSEKPQLEENDVIIFTVFDLPYLNEDLHKKPFIERRKKLESFYSQHLKGSKNFDITEYKKVSNRAELEAAFRKFAKYPQSEGIVIKDVNSTWSTTGRESGWAKLKVEAEIKAMVLKVHKVKDGYNYHCGVLKGNSDFKNVVRVGDMEIVELGKTYNTKLKAKVGDILTIAVEEIIPNDELSWLGARVIDIDLERKEPYFANQVITIARNANILQKRKFICECIECGHTIESDEHCRDVKCPKCGGQMRRKERPGPGQPVAKADDEGTVGQYGNIDFKLGDKGRGIAQIHIMGLKEEEAQKLKANESRVLMARADIRKLQSVLKSLIGEQGAHIDIRLQRSGDKYWEGGEIMIGNISGLTKLLQKDKKLRFGWKQPRVEEPKIPVIRGPMSWFEAGSRSIKLFKPGEVGATANMYAAMIRIDSFNWELYKADEHAKKLHITDSRLFNGNWLFAFVPTGDKERVWMMSKLKDDDHRKEQGKEPVEKSMMFRIYKLNKRKHLVGGVVYEPETIDSQGDYTDAEEIEKAIERFMEKYSKDPKRIRVNHKGQAYYFPIIECFQPETDIKKGGKTVKAGSWWLMVKVTDNNIWQLIESGKLTGFSMGGRASEAK